MWKAWAGRLAKQDSEIAKIQESATEQNKALAILLSEHTSMLNDVNANTALITANTTLITALDRSLAVLQSQVLEHHRWVDRQRHLDRTQPL